MSAIVEKLIAAHPAKHFVLATTKSEALVAFDRIRMTIEEMDDFDKFPEGPTGVILYAVLKNASETCPDVGDFNYIRQGCAMAMDTVFRVIADEVDWFPRVRANNAHHPCDRRS